MKKAHSTIIADFEAHLKANGLAASTVALYMSYARRFAAHVGDVPIDRVSEKQVREYFKGIAKPATKIHQVHVVSDFITFSLAALPVVVNKAGGAIPPPVRKLNKKEIALRDKWTLEKMQAEAERKDKVIARMARQLVAHYVHFQKQLKGEPLDLDEVARLADESSELIQSNLMLFMGLSAERHNINPKFSERILP